MMRAGFSWQFLPAASAERCAGLTRRAPLRLHETSALFSIPAPISDAALSTRFPSGRPHRIQIPAQAKQAMRAQGGAVGRAVCACRPNQFPVARGVMRAVTAPCPDFGRGFGLARLFAGGRDGQ
ncbi:hypothetical protein DEM26_08915 [Thioclava sp. NG1]|nr:hypothetical protein DEM26_08915 [Thioclava sp. NG1]